MTIFVSVYVCGIIATAFWLGYTDDEAPHERTLEQVALVAVWPIIIIFALGSAVRAFRKR